MNDQSQIMNQHQVQSRSQVFLANQSHDTMNKSQMMMNRSQMLNQLQNQPQVVNQHSSQVPMVNQLSQPMIPQPQMMNQLKRMGRNYSQWSQPLPNMPLPPNPMNAMKFASPMNLMYGGNVKPKRSSWKAKKPMAMDKRKDVRWKDKGSGVGVGGYQPPTLNELEQQNRLKARRFYHKKKFNRMGPYAHAPRNTTSYIIRAKKSGGIASLVSPCPVTPAVLPTPVFSPSREALVEMAKEEWGVDGYGSMKGLIRLRSPGHEETLDDYDEEDEEGSSESDVEEHVEVERRLDHDLSRFEMVYPNSSVDYHHNVLENRVDDQDTRIAQLEEENLILKERLYWMEREVGELRRRLLCLERQHQVVEDVNDEVVENVSENDSGGVRSTTLYGGKHNEEVDFVPRNGAEESGSRRDDSCKEMSDKVLGELAMTEGFHSDALENNHNDEHVQEPGIAQTEEQSRDNEPVGDVCMGQRVAEEIVEHYQFNGVNEKTVINLDHDGVVSVEVQREGNNCSD